MHIHFEFVIFNVVINHKILNFIIDVGIAGL